MKTFGVALALFCLLAYASAEFEYEPLEESYESSRFRREANPQGSIVLEGSKRQHERPSLDLNYQQRVYDRNGLTANAYGGVNMRPGQSTQPHFGVNMEKTYRNGFIRGQTQLQRGPGGRLEPMAGLQSGFRFRRDTEYLGDEEERY